MIHRKCVKYNTIQYSTRQVDSYYYPYLGKSKEASHLGEPNKGETLQSLSLCQSTRAFSIQKIKKVPELSFLSAFISLFFPLSWIRNPTCLSQTPETVLVISSQRKRNYISIMEKWDSSGCVSAFWWCHWCDL